MSHTQTHAPATPPQAPLGSFGGAGLLWHAPSASSPCLVHGNDYKQRTFGAIVAGLRAEGWPPRPLEVGTSLGPLTVRWTDDLAPRLDAWQRSNGAWLPSPDCGGLDTGCMTSHLEVLVEQRLMAAELERMQGDTFPLLALLRGKRGRYAHFYVDMLLRGVLGHRGRLRANATVVLRRAARAAPGFVPAAHALAEALHKFGGGDPGGSGEDHEDSDVAGQGQATIAESRRQARDALAASICGYRHRATAAVHDAYPWRGGGDGGGGAAAPTVHLVTVANREDAALVDLRRAARRLGYPPLHVLGSSGGFGDLGGAWPGLGVKVKLLRDWLVAGLAAGASDYPGASSGGAPSESPAPAVPRLGPDSLVLFLDAFDVLLLPAATPAAVARRFASLGASLVFGAEASASPDTAAALLYASSAATAGAAQGAKVPWPWSRHRGDAVAEGGPFLNSGTIIGGAGAMLQAAEEAWGDMTCHGRDELGRPVLAAEAPENPFDSNDQRYFTRLYLRQFLPCGFDADTADDSGSAATKAAATTARPRMVLDASSALFLTLHGLESANLTVAPGGAVTAWRPADTDADSAAPEEGEGPAEEFLILHGNGEDALFKELVAKVRAAAGGWPDAPAADTTGARSRAASSGVLSPAASVAVENSAVAAAAEDEEEAAVVPSVRDLALRLRFDPAFPSLASSLCGDLIAEATDRGGGRNGGRSSGDAGVGGGTVRVVVEVNGAAVDFVVARRADPLAEAFAFARAHGLQAGAGCVASAARAAHGASSAAAEGANEACTAAAEEDAASGVRCVAEHLALAADRTRLVAALEAMHGPLAADLVGSYRGPLLTDDGRQVTTEGAAAEGEVPEAVNSYGRDDYSSGAAAVPYDRFLDNVLRSGVLRDAPHLRRNATRALRCALLRPRRPLAAGRPHFASAAYTLADTLRAIGEAGDRERAAASGDATGSDGGRGYEGVSDDGVSGEEASGALLDAADLVRASVLAPFPRAAARAPFAAGSAGGGVEADAAEAAEGAEGVDGSCPAAGAVHVVTVATEERAELRALRASLLQTFRGGSGGATFTVLGLGRTWGGLASKLSWLRAWLRRCGLDRRPCAGGSDDGGPGGCGSDHSHGSDDDGDGPLVVFVDAYDVLATAAAAEVRARFFALRRGGGGGGSVGGSGGDPGSAEGSGADLIFGGEVLPAPDAAVRLLRPRAARDGCDDGSDSNGGGGGVGGGGFDASREDLPLPHLNSGLFIGYGWAVGAMLNEVLDDLAFHHGSGLADLAQVDDQRWCTRFLLRRTLGAPARGAQPNGVLARVGAAVDVRGLIFHSLHAVAPDALAVVDARAGVVASAHTGTEPCFLHGNAGGRAALAAVTEALSTHGAWLNDA